MKKRYVFEYTDDNGTPSSLAVEAKDKRQAIAKITRFLTKPKKEDVKLVKPKKP